MATFSPQVRHHLDRYRRGEVGDALHGLLELGDAVLPELVAEFHAVTDTDSRRFLLHVIWQYRRESVIPLLSEALLDAEPLIWREALDGLVSLACPAAVEALLARTLPGRSNVFPYRARG